jgi:hypothetical protein
MSGLLHGYGHADEVALLLAGYPRAVMAEIEDEANARAHRRHQDERAAEEARSAREADEPAEARAHTRRAEKAAYLRDKLGEAERAIADEDEPAA